MYRAFAIVILVCSLALVGLDLSSANTGQAAWDAVGVVIAIWFWFSDRGRRKRLEGYARAEAQRAARRATQAQMVFKRNDFDALLSATERNLGSAGFLVSRNVMLPSGDSVDLAASRIEFTWHGVINVPVVQHFLLQCPRIPAIGDFDTLFEAGFRYATGVHRNSLLRRERFGHVILPCMAVDAATPELIAFASGRPPKRWMRFEFPVLYDLSTGRAYYCEQTPATGAMFFPGARELVHVAFDGVCPAVAS